MIIYGRGYGNVFIKTWLTIMVTIFLFSCCVIVIVSDAKLLMTSKDVRSSGDTRQIFLSRVSTSEYRQPPSIRRVFQTNAH